MEDPYTNREIDRLFNEIKIQLDRIESQTTKTNGRVSSLERYKAGLVMSIGLISFVIIPLVVFIFDVSQQNLENKIINQLYK